MLLGESQAYDFLRFLGTFWIKVYFSNHIIGKVDLYNVLDEFRYLNIAWDF